MRKITVELEDFLYLFFEKVGKAAGKPTETVIAEMLFRIAGEASLRALDAKKRKE